MSNESNLTPAPAGVAEPDDFRGDTASLVRNIIALLALDAEGALVPHGVGGHARGLLSAAAARLAAAPVKALTPAFADGLVHSTVLHKLWEESEPTAQRGQPGALAWQLGVFAGKVAQAAAAPAQAVAVPAGFALVPMRMTPAMERVLHSDEDGWQWEDLLAAANAVTEEEYVSIARGDLTHAEIREVFLSNGFTIKEGHTDLKPYVYAAARDLLAAAPAQAVAVPQVFALCESVEAQNAGDTEFERGMRTAAKRIRKEVHAGAPAQEHATQLAGQGQDFIGIAETWEQSADDTEACKSERSQPDYAEGLVAGMRQCAADLRAAAPIRA